MELVKTIVNNGRSVLSLARDDDNIHFVIKACAAEHPSVQEQTQLLNEREIGNALDHPGIRSGAADIFFMGRQGLRMEYIDGHDCSGLEAMPVSAFFELAIQVSKALSYVHDQGVLHRDINIFNILFDSKLHSYRIIDFGQAVRLPLEIRGSGGMPAYMAPEATGRIKATADHRADLYSLGVVFYELLTGRNPFMDPELAKIIHRHIAWMPEAPNLVRSGIPVTLSKICMKLLAKNPADRYPNGHSLVADLQETQLLYRRNIEPGDFVAGQQFKAAPFNQDPPLTGYAQQSDELHRHFKSAREGNSTLSVLSGFPKSGKTALVDKLLSEILASNAIYIRLQDEYGVDKPFGQLYALLERIVSRIGQETAGMIERRKAVLHSSDMSDLSLLNSRIPGLAMLTGESVMDEKFGSLESQNRFHLALQDLLRGLALPEKPLVIHFASAADIDKETLSFLIRFIHDLRNVFIWVILEDDPGDEKSIRKGEFPFSKEEIINLEGIDNFQVETLCRSMLNAGFDGMQDLLDKVTSYSQTMPGKVVGLMNHWFMNGIIGYNQGKQSWHFPRDLKGIPLYPATENPALGSLDAFKRSILNWIGLIQTPVSILTLSELSGIPTAEVQSHIGELLLRGILSESTNNQGIESFGIAENIQSSDLIHFESGDLVRMHTKIASLLREKDQPDLFRLAHHINRACELDESSFDTGTRFQVNLNAGLKAKEEGAFNSARRFLDIAVRLMESNTTLSDEHVYELFLNIAELSQLDGNLDMADEYFDKALSRAGDELKQAELFSRRIVLFNHQGKLHEAFHTGRKALDLLGYSIPEKANKLAVLGHLITTQFRIGRRSPEDLLSLPDATNPKTILALRILEDLHPATFHISGDVLVITLLKALKMTLKEGNTPEAYSAYTGYGAILALGFRNFRKGWEYTLAGSEMTLKFPGKLYQGRGLFSKGAWIINYIMHAKESRPVLEEAYRLSIDSGDFTYATYSAQNLIELHFTLGTRLSELQIYVDEYVEFTYKIGYDDILLLSLVTKDFIMKLMGREEEAQELSATWFKGRNLEQFSRETSYTHVRLYYLLINAFRQYLAGNSAQAFELIRESESLLYTLQGPAIIVDYYMIDGLITYESILAGEGDDSALKKRLRSRVKKLKPYSRLVPENFSHKYGIVYALELDVSGNKYKARKMMRKALEDSRLSGYLQVEALSAMYLARWYKKENVNDYYRLHAKTAFKAFERWDAPVMMDRMQEEFPDALPSRKGSSSLYSYSDPENAYNDWNLDPAAIMKAANTMSAETDLENLLSAMSQILAEHAGSTRTLLFIMEDDKPRLLLESTPEKHLYFPYPGIETEGKDVCPDAIIRHVFGSQEFVIIDDTRVDNRFSFDPYFSNRKGFSLIAFPLQHRGSLSGIMYLENTMLTSAFPEERTSFLRMLSSQFAIALQNARLVEDLEIMVQSRTEELKSEKDRSDSLLRNILPVETAEELKLKGTATPRLYDSVTVLFADMKGFTSISEKMPPEDLVRMLDFYFRGFDKIITQHGLEKIKTIGDAYLCVAGLPTPMEDHAIRAAEVAVEIIRFMKEARESQGYGLELRVGLHSGPVITGVVGENKFAFDIWGDTVNTASRLESASEAGRINISSSTKELLLGHSGFITEYRGKIPAKNKGEIDMYFLESAGSWNDMPDDSTAIAHILAIRENNLDERLTYHSLSHTREVMQHAERIGKMEGIDEQSLCLIRTAAAYHDSGFLTTYKGHELESCRIARQTLPAFNFSAADIEKVCGMIMATQIPQEPKSQAEKILCDADLCYLGTDDYETISSKLYQEFIENDILCSEQEWIDIQIRFLKGHSFHTRTVSESCTLKKAEHLARLIAKGDSNS